MSEPRFFEDLFRIIEEMGRRNLVIEVRVRDKGTIAALKEHVEEKKESFGGGLGFLVGVPIYYDAEIPAGVMRFYRSDGQTDDLLLT